MGGGSQLRLMNDSFQQQWRKEQSCSSLGGSVSDGSVTICSVLYYEWAVQHWWLIVILSVTWVSFCLCDPRMSNKRASTVWVNRDWLQSYLHCKPNNYSNLILTESITALQQTFSIPGWQGWHCIWFLEVCCSVNLSFVGALGKILRILFFV